MRPIRQLPLGRGHAWRGGQRLRLLRLLLENLCLRLLLDLLQPREEVDRLASGLALP